MRCCCVVAIAAPCKRKCLTKVIVVVWTLFNVVQSEIEEDSLSKNRGTSWPPLERNLRLLALQVIIQLQVMLWFTKVSNNFTLSFEDLAVLCNENYQRPNQWRWWNLMGGWLWWLDDVHRYMAKLKEVASLEVSPNQDDLWHQCNNTMWNCSILVTVKRFSIWIWALKGFYRKVTWLLS